MSVTDLIADQLTVVRNALRAGKKTVIIKRSGVLEGIMEIIKREGFIDNYRTIEDNRQGQIKIYLKYTDGDVSAMEGLTRGSKPGRRQYVPAKKVKNVRGGAGIAILSTSKGLLTDSEARQQGVGGEVVCQVW